MTYQYILVAIALAGALWYILHHVRKAFLPAADGCGGDCGCASADLKQSIKR